MSKPVAVRTNKSAGVKRERDDNWRPNPRPNAFFVTLYQPNSRAALVDPTEPLTHDCWVVAKIGDDYLEGRLVTKHPEKAKTLTVRFDGGIIRGFSKADVLRIVSVQRNI